MFKDKDVADDGLGTGENKFPIDAFFSDFKRMMKAQMEELHEKLDRLESTRVKQSQNTPSYRWRRPLAPTVAEHEYWGREHEEDYREPFRNNRDYEGRNTPNSNSGNVKIKIPLFQGNSDPEAYLEWEEKMELVFDRHNLNEKKKVRLATFQLCDYANTWWDRLCIDKRRSGEDPIATWAEMKRVMRRRFVPSHYHRNLYLQGLHQEDNSIIVSNAKPEAKATTTAIKVSQESLSTSSTPSAAKLTEPFANVEVKCFETEPKAGEEVVDTMPSLFDTIEDESEDANHDDSMVVDDCLTLNIHIKSGADMMFESKPVLNCIEDPTPYILECSKEFVEVRINKQNDMPQLLHERVYEDPFLVYVAKGLNLLRGINHQVDFIFDPGDWQPQKMSFAKFPSHRKAILDSRGKDSGRIFLRKGGMM